MATDDTRTRILQAAGPAFAELGFKEATVREICRRAEVNLASINYHFGDKERLYVETIRHAHQLQKEREPLPEWGEDTSPETKLRDFVHATIRRMLVVREAAWQERLMTRELLEPTGVCAELVEDYIRPHFEQLLGILDELVPESIPPYKRHQLAFSVVGQCLHYRFGDEVVRMLIPEDERKTHYAPAQLANHIADMILAALGRRPLFGESADDVAAAQIQLSEED